MKGLPPEIDELMWTIAESDDLEAIDEFGDRYPEFRGEMGKRLQMVRGLRGSRPQSARAKSTPKRFVPSKHEVVYREPSRWMMPAAAAFVLVSVVFATYAVTTYAQRKNEPTTTVVQQPTGTPDPVQIQPDTGEHNEPAVTTQNPPPQNPPAPDQPKPFDRPVTLTADRISLANALNLIARQIGVTLTSAPGMPDVEISADYRNVAASQVLADLGRNFGFTPMIQSEREALLIPAVDPTGMDNARPPAGSSAEFEISGPGNPRTETP